MTTNRLISTFLIVACGLLLHAGCEEEAMAPREMSSDWFQQFGQPVQQQGRPVQQQVRPTVRPRVSTSSPRITFEKVVHDFGNLGPHTSNLCEFRFKNTGNGVLRIGEVTKTCGCTPFSLAKKQYAPGESGTLKVKYYSDTQLGHITKNLSVHSNDRTKPDVTLALKAHVMTKVNYEPKTLSLLLKQENGGSPKITLTSVDGRPFSISHFKSTADYITADYNPSVKAMSFVLEPKVDMARLEKTLDGRIEIGLTHPECKTVTVGLRTVPKFRVAPASISVHGAKSQRQILKKVRILSNYGEGFDLASTSSKKGAVRVMSNTMVPNGYELELEIKPPPAGTRAGVFTETLFVNTKNGERLEIPCRVFYSRATASRPVLPASTEKSDKCPHCGPRIITSAGVNARDF
jgi:hypothetical protein